MAHVMVGLRAMLVDGLASMFVDAAVKAMSVLADSHSEVRSPATAEAYRHLFQRPPAAPRKPAVLIVGLKGAQKTEIERDYAAQFDLRFVGADESKDQLRAQTEKAATTVVMTDFVSHSHEDIVKARSSNWIRQSGGMTGLRATLAGLQ